MQVIMIDSEKPPPNQVSPKIIADEFINRNLKVESSPAKKYSQQGPRGINLIRVGKMGSDKDPREDSSAF